MTNITRHAIRNSIKSGAGFQTMCEKFQCTKEELDAAIRRLYRYDSEKIFKEIQTNEKKYQRRIANAVTKRKIPTPIMNHSDTMQTPEDLHCISSPGGCTEGVSISRADQIIMLKAQETEMSNRVIALESDRKALFSQHRTNLEKLHELRNQLEAIQQQFIRTNKDYEAIVTENNQLLEKLDSLSEQKAAEATKLTEIRQKIEDLEAITVCVYHDGRIEPLEDTDVALDDSGNEEIFYTMLNQCAEKNATLRICDIKTLARIDAIIRNSAHRIDFLFDDDNLENCYMQFA